MRSETGKAAFVLPVTLIWFLAILSIAALFTLGSPAWAKTQRVESGQIGTWAFVAFAGDPDEYASCSVSTANQGGVQFGVWADRLVGWRMWLGADSWKLTEGAEYDVRYVIDDQTPVAAKAIAVLDNSVHIQLGDEYAATDVLRRAGRISVQTEQQSFTFSLSGSARALDRMRDCARKWLHEADASADPFSKDASKSESPTSPSDSDIPQRWSGSLREFFKPAQVGPWTIDAYTESLYHAFSYCQAGPPEADGHNLLIKLDRRLDWSIMILNVDWHLQPGIPLHVRYSVDSGPIATAEGRVIIAQSTTVELGQEPELITTLRRGKRFRFQVNGEDFSFDLSGASRALDATQKCVKHYAAEG